MKAARVGRATQQAVGPTNQFWERVTRLVAESDADVLISVNNAENIARDVAIQAVNVLRDARDLFHVRRVHWLVVGNSDFVDAVVTSIRQVAASCRNRMSCVHSSPRMCSICWRAAMCSSYGLMWSVSSGATLLAMLPEAEQAGKDLSAYKALRDLAEE